MSGSPGPGLIAGAADETSPLSDLFPAISLTASDPVLEVVAAVTRRGLTGFGPVLSRKNRRETLHARPS